MCTDHSKFTTGGSVSNHHSAAALDIAAIDGEIVGPAARWRARWRRELSELDPSIRPDEIGSPFAITGPGYFTDAAHQNHIHVGFDRQIAPDFKPPAERGGRRRPGRPGAPAAVAPRAARRGGAVAAPRGAAAPTASASRACRRGRSATPTRASSRRATARPRTSAPATPACSLARRQARAAPPPPRRRQPGAPTPRVDLAGAPTDYPGDDAPQEQIAAWMAAEAKKRGLPPQLPVMAALVESSLKNLNFGDADSVGFFQMRVGIWNQGDVRGLPRRSREADRLVPRPGRERQGAARRRAASRSTTPTSSATGSPTSNAPPSSSAAATSSASTRPTACSPTPPSAAGRGRRRRRTPPAARRGADRPGGSGQDGTGRRSRAARGEGAAEERERRARRRGARRPQGGARSTRASSR